MAKMFQLNVHIPYELNDKITEVCQRTGTTKSHWIRKELWEAVENEKPVYEYGSDEADTAYETMTVELMDERISKLEKDIAEKEEEKSWIRKKLRI